MNRTTFAALALVLAAPAAAARAQAPTPANPIELGIDAGVTFGLDAPNTTTINIPGQQFRMGFFFSPNISFEPAVGLQSAHTKGSTITSYNAVVGMLYHFTPDRNARQLYVRPFFGVTGTHATGADNSTQAALGAGLGVKIPLVSRLSSRFEANYRHGFSSGDNESSNAIGLLAGLSFFTR